MKMMHAVLLGAAMLTPELVSSTLTAQATSATVWTKGTPPVGGAQRETFYSNVMYVSTRKADGKVEIHQTQSDILVIQAGEADFLSGGEGVGMATTGPNEMMGTSITGGTKVHVMPGDVIHVPVGMPHQFFIKSGTEMTYLVIKVTKH